MSERTLAVVAAIVVALSLLLFLAPLIGIVVVAVIALGVPGLLFLDRNGAVRRHRAGPGASGPRDRGYQGYTAVGDEGGAADYTYRRRAS
jgi:hypothetical protein